MRRTCSLEVGAVLEQLTLIEAGQALGISPDAVRMRIKRGSMQAEKDAEGRWLVWVDVEQAAAEREVEREPGAAGERDLEREGELSAEALRAQIAVLEARLAAAESERDFLRTQVENLIMIQGMTAQKALPNPARRGWWARLFGGSSASPGAVLHDRCGR
jgi:DNA-binding transcriptional MerR regulator